MMTIMIRGLRPYLGADPEFFFKQQGQTIGSEKVLPKGGAVPGSFNNIIIDGVQAEFNVGQSTCRQSFSGNLRSCFFTLSQTLKAKKIEADFRSTVEITDQALAEISPQNQQFGCDPSINNYRKTDVKIKDASKYHYRSAGGHIHLGKVGADETHQCLTETGAAKTVAMLDIILGNTCVLIDRDPGNIERRQNYGRAGEYRLPKHGLEYRTLSNFWLRSYPLTSLVMGLARLAVCVAATPAAEKAILEKTDLAAIEEAINTNNFDLAYENFNKIKDILASLNESLGANSSLNPFWSDRIGKFEHLVKKGIDTAFPVDPVLWWTTNGLGYGWENYAHHYL